jgi:hypothetical protein
MWRRGRRRGRVVGDEALPLAQRCRISADLAGPKIRTGSLTHDAAVLKVAARDGAGLCLRGTLWLALMRWSPRQVRPRKSEHGSVTAPARVWLTSLEAPSAPPHGVTNSEHAPTRARALSRCVACVHVRCLPTLHRVRASSVAPPC